VTDDDATQLSRRTGLALVAALTLSALLAALVGVFAEDIASSPALFYLLKKRYAREGPPVDVVVVGASQSVASIRPDLVAPSLPPGTRLYNYGVPGMDPSGGEVLLREYFDAHAPPTLVVVAFTSLIYTDRRAEFERYTLNLLLGPADVWNAIVADQRPSYALAWLAGRIPTVRLREGLRTAIGASILDALPALQPTVRGWMGIPDSAQGLYRFDWRYTHRVARNRELVQEVVDSGGYHFWKENAPDRSEAGLRALTYEARRARRPGVIGWQRATRAEPPQPFTASPRARAALMRIFRMCEARAVPVLVLALPHSPFLMRALTADGGGQRLDAFWTELAAQPGVTVMQEGPRVVLPDRFFSDPTHSNPKGAQRYSAMVAPIIARAFREARGP
jgi:hypothetical protein